MALPDLTALRMSGVTPFVTHRDGLNDRLRQAHALMLVLELHYRIVADLPSDGSIEGINVLNPTVTADAIEGVAALIAMAQHHVDCASEERRAS